MEFIFSQCSDKGKVRDQNEDFHGHASNPYIDAHIFCVADGMGGYGAGDIASKSVINSVTTEFKNIKRFTAGAIKDSIASLFHTAQQELASIRQSKGKTMMGTTLAILVFYERLVISANVGDTRIYCFDGQELKQLSYDHTVVNEMLNNKTITPEQAILHPKKHILTKALTGEDNRVEPHINILTHFDHNIYLICTDGLYNMVNDNFLRIRLKGSSIFEAKDQLLKEVYVNGARDNVTFQIIKAFDNEATIA
ncbi:PP2C family protein-serine/threonine phosphatase [Desulfonatronovibrio magnus]|uniref:PP2C family protein-serine/threonine phosphatase n=1 Tax=Desulfonatronovibrio magnus TaxID=698827 RepID=UPI0005EB6BDD|nr:protein phosphatase 2C domain-containing protein [Desulfonatronovibrio magnus]